MSTLALPRPIATTPQPRKGTYSDYLRLLSQRAWDDGRVSVSQRDAVQCLHVSRMTVHLWTIRALTCGDLQNTGEWWQRQRVYRILRPGKLPPQSETLHVNFTSQFTSQQVIQKSEVPEITTDTIENIDAARAKTAPAAPTVSQAQSKEQVNSQGKQPDLFDQFIGWAENITGILLQRCQVGMICRAAKQAGLSFWHFWQGLIEQRHNLRNMNNLGGCLYRLAQRGLVRTWPTKAPEARPQGEREQQQRPATQPQMCPTCHGQGKLGDRRNRNLCSTCNGAGRVPNA